MSYADFLTSPAAKTIAPILNADATVREMESLSRSGRPAVQALDSKLADKVRLDNTERQHVGRWIRDVLGRRGWQPGLKRRVVNGRLFSSGAVYVRASANAGSGTAVPPSLLETADRVARARAMIATLPNNGYSVDDYLRDKYAEAAREAQR